MEALSGILRYFSGEFEGLNPKSLAGQDVTSTLATAVGITLNELSLPGATEILDGMLSRGEILRALTLLKLLSEVDPEGSHLLLLLSHILETEIEGRPSAPFHDPLAVEFLGSDRAHVAWSTLRRDTLEFVRLPSEGESAGPDCWTICLCKPAEGSPEVTGMDSPESGPWALVWHTGPIHRGRSRAIGARRAPRTRVHLPARVVLLGRVERTRPAHGYSAEIADVSATGAGLILPNPHGVLQASELMERRVRLEVPLPEEGREVSTLAEVHWCRPDPKEGQGSLRVGLQFYDPPEPFVEAVREWMKDRKGERHFLWNLWDTLATRP